MDFIEIVQDILYFLLKVLIVVLVIAITFLVGAMLGYSFCLLYTSPSPRD